MKIHESLIKKNIVLDFELHHWWGSPLSVHFHFSRFLLSANCSKRRKHNKILNDNARSTERMLNHLRENKLRMFCTHTHRHTDKHTKVDESQNKFCRRWKLNFTISSQGKMCLSLREFYEKKRKERFKSELATFPRAFSRRIVYRTCHSLFSVTSDIP